MKIERHSDFSVLVTFPSCRLASEFERGLSSPAESDKEAIRNAALEEAAMYLQSQYLRQFAKEVRALKSQPAQPQAHDEMGDEMRSFIEGMSVSIDVSTGEHDAQHRLFGTVAEVMDSGSDKHGVVLLVHDQKPNFQPAQPSDAKCNKCGQSDDGQTGEYPCAACGLPILHDEQPNEWTEQDALLELIHLKFQSGNDIPVERITLTRDEVNRASPEFLT